jgi:hypothetical protein
VINTSLLTVRNVVVIGLIALIWTAGAKVVTSKFTAAS